MKYVLSLLVFLVLANTSNSYAADLCPASQRKLNEGEPCIPEVLFNYLYCLSKSGGGKVEIGAKTDMSDSKGREISVGGKGSGVVISAAGALSIKQQDATRAVREVSERIDPSLASKCESFARNIVGNSAASRITREEPPHVPGKVTQDRSSRPASEHSRDASLQVPSKPAPIVQDNVVVDEATVKAIYSGQYCPLFHTGSYLSCSASLDSCNRTSMGLGRCERRPEEIHCYARDSDPRLNCFPSLQRCQNEIDSARKNRTSMRYDSPRLSASCATIRPS